MCGHEVHTRPGTPALMVKLFGRSTQSGCQISNRQMTSPEIANRIPKPVVPLSPTRWESADLVAAWSTVPWLGDKFYCAPYRVLAAGFKKTALIIKPIGFSS